MFFFATSLSGSTERTSSNSALASSHMPSIQYVSARSLRAPRLAASRRTASASSSIASSKSPVNPKTRPSCRWRLRVLVVELDNRAELDLGLVVAAFLLQGKTTFDSALLSAPSRSPIQSVKSSQ